MGLLCPCPNSKMPRKRYQRHFMGPPTDPGPSGSARVFQMVSPHLGPTLEDYATHYPLLKTKPFLTLFIHLIFFFNSQ
ncbi:unnamed protein product [Staurois parvus]|uniref:Uncharacterized protein n=1 Tax=Staurois parvus TaxID=386267 RepID=A0ABN9FQ61_9NEOB|nr:unnamed protein product [Staurois parvus]